MTQPLFHFDNLHQTTTSTGPTTFSLNGTTPHGKTFAVACADYLGLDPDLSADQCRLPLCIRPQAATDNRFVDAWFIYDDTAQTITMDGSPIRSSASNDAAITWGVEIKNVFSIVPMDIAQRLHNAIRCGLATGSVNSPTFENESLLPNFYEGLELHFTASGTNTSAADYQGDPIQLNGLALAGGEMVGGLSYFIRREGSTWQLGQKEGNTDLPASVAFPAIIAPAQITADQNNWNPTGWPTAAGIQLDLDANRSFTGLAGGRKGRRATLYGDDAFAATLVAGSASSTAINRFGFTEDLVIHKGMNVELEHDGTFWRLLGSNVLRRPPVVERPFTILSAPMDSSGLPNYGASTGSATVTATGDFLVSAPIGFDAYGRVDLIGRITNPSWTGLNVNGTMYMLFGGFTPTLTTVSTTIRPVIQEFGTPSTTNGQYTYNAREKKCYLGNGSSAVVTPFKPAGEVTVAGNVVTAIRWYAIGDKFVSAWTNTLPNAGVEVTFNANIGHDLFDIELEVMNISTELGWSVDNIVPGAHVALASAVNVVTHIKTRLLAGFIVPNTRWQIISRSAASDSVAIDRAKWAYRLTATPRT